MNKNNAINKINKYGKVGRIITIVMIVLVSISIVSTVAAAILLNCIPDNVISLSMGTQAELTLNPGAMGTEIPDAEFDQVVDAFNDGTVKGGLNLGAVSLQFDSAERVGDTVVARTNAGLGTVSLHKIAEALIYVIIALVLTLISIVFAFRLCKAFEHCETPFAEEVIKRMRYFAYSLLPWAIFSSVPESVLDSVFGKQLEVSFNLDMNIIFTVLIIMALTIVFKYGAMLQQESDETL